MDKKSIAKEIIEWIVCFIIAITIALLVRYYVGTPTMVKNVSMNPTLEAYQRLWLNRLPRTLKQKLNRGDIVTFEAPTKTEVKEYEIDYSNAVAEYNYEPQGVFNKLIYYVLELNKTSYIKRVIGLPGEHIKIEDGKVYINEEELEEKYLPAGLLTEMGERCFFSDFVVPEGAYFVMGDNRSQSTDSRSFGCIPFEKIESKVAFRFWPLNLFGGVK